MVVATGLLGFLVAPFVFIAIKGLLGLVVAGTISFVTIQFLPWFGAMVANWRLKAIKHEAAKNPIETLQNDLQGRIQALQQFRDAIRNFAGEVGTFKDKLVDFKHEYPERASMFEEQYSQMQQLLELRIKKYEDAKVGLARYEKEIERADAEWQMAQAAAQMNKAAGVDAEAFLQKIQVDTAFDSVQKGLNSAFADLKISLLDEKGLPAPSSSPVAALPSNTPKALPEPSGEHGLDLNIDVGATSGSAASGRRLKSN